MEVYEMEEPKICIVRNYALKITALEDKCQPDKENVLWGKKEFFFKLQNPFLLETDTTQKEVA